jgi:hypothetical protein
MQLRGSDNTNSNGSADDSGADGIDDASGLHHGNR